MLDLIRALLASLVAETNEVPLAAACLPTDSILTILDNLGDNNG